MKEYTPAMTIIIFSLIITLTFASQVEWSTIKSL